MNLARCFIKIIILFYSFIHFTHIRLLRIKCLSGTDVGPEDTVSNKRDEFTINMVVVF